MKVFLKKKSFYVFVLTLLFSSTLNAETFRVKKIVTLSVPETASSPCVKAGIQDGIIIELPEDKTFIEGIELNFKVPQIVTEWHDSIAWSFYKELKPSPSMEKNDYSGTRGYTGTFGSSYNLCIQIPLTEKNTIKKNPYAHYVEEVPELIDGKIFLRLQLVMKGTDDDISSGIFEVSARPLLVNKGKLSINLSAPDDKKLKAYTAYLDNKIFSISNKPVILSSGVHTLSLVSDFYRNEVRTVNIEQAKETSLNIKFRDIAPSVMLLAPEGTVIYFDDVKTSKTNKMFTVSQGSHTIKFIIGDYETVRTINAVNGRSYTVAVNLETEVSEED